MKEKHLNLISCLVTEFLGHSLLIFKFIVLDKISKAWKAWGGFCLFVFCYCFYFVLFVCFKSFKD